MNKRKPAKVRLVHPTTGQTVQTREDLADRYRANGWQEPRNTEPERGDQ